MPLIILLIGIILVAVGINNKVPELITLLKEDFRPTDGSPGFHYWILAIVIIGALGYIKTFKGFSHGFLALILIVIILADQKRSGKQGFFVKFTKALEGKTK